MNERRNLCRRPSYNQTNATRPAQPDQITVTKSAKLDPVVPIWLYQSGCSVWLHWSGCVDPVRWSGCFQGPVARTKFPLSAVGSRYRGTTNESSYQTPYSERSTEQTAPVMGSICQISRLFLYTTSLTRMEKAKIAPISEFTAEKDHDNGFTVRVQRLQSSEATRIKSTGHSLRTTLSKAFQVLQEPCRLSLVIHFVHRVRYPSDVHSKRADLVNLWTNWLSCVIAVIC